MWSFLFAFCLGVLTHKQNSVSKCEALVRPLFDCRVKSGTCENDRALGSYSPPDIFGVPFPQFGAKIHVRDAVQIGIGELPEKLVHAEIEL
jgi:hypothetical protein